MSRYVFVPLTDEILYEHPELINGPIVPYRPDRACYRWMSVELNPTEDAPPKAESRPQSRRDAATAFEPPRVAAHSH